MGAVICRAPTQGHALDRVMLRYGRRPNTPTGLDHSYGPGRSDSNKPRHVARVGKGSHVVETTCPSSSELESTMRNVLPRVPAMIRPATAADVSAIGQIETLSFAHPGERFAEKKLRYLVRSPRVVTIVAERETTIVGWAAGHVWTRGREPWGRVYAIAVHPEARGMRLGPRLMEYMIGVLRQRGAGAIFLEARTDNHAAIRLYERLGFTPCATLEHYYAQGMPAVRMRLPPEESPEKPPEMPPERSAEKTA
jgi:ribosomal-protein-alanine N-acetyltransferase